MMMRATHTTQSRKKGKKIKIQFELTPEQQFYTSVKIGDRVDFTTDNKKWYEAVVFNIEPFKIPKCEKWNDNNRGRATKFIIKPLICHNTNLKMDSHYSIYYHENGQQIWKLQGLKCHFTKLYTHTKNWRDNLKVHDLVDFIIPAYIQEYYKTGQIPSLHSTMFKSSEPQAEILARQLDHQVAVGLVLSISKNDIFISTYIEHLCNDSKTECRTQRPICKSTQCSWVIQLRKYSEDLYCINTIPKLKRIRSCWGETRRAGRLCDDRCCFPSICTNRQYLNPNKIPQFIINVIQKYILFVSDKKFKTDDTSCPICFEENASTSLGCGHILCNNCFQQYTDHHLEKGKDIVNMSCPLCRNNIFETLTFGGIKGFNPIGTDDVPTKKHLNVFFPRDIVIDKFGKKYIIKECEHISYQVNNEISMVLLENLTPLERVIWTKKSNQTNEERSGRALFKNIHELERCDKASRFLSGIYFKIKKDVNIKKEARKQAILYNNVLKGLAKHAHTITITAHTLNSKCERSKEWWSSFILYIIHQHPIKKYKFDIMIKLLKIYYPLYDVTFVGTRGSKYFNIGKNDIRKYMKPKVYFI